MNEANATPEAGEYVSTAPCAEISLTQGEVCQFGYLNLGQFHSGGGGAVPVDLDALAGTVRILVRALDDAIEASLAHYPSTLTVQVMRAKRRIGVGVCGLADLLLAAGLPYDSPEGRQLAQDVLAFINYQSKLASVELAGQRGACPAVVGGRSRYADPGFLQRFALPGVRTVSPDNWSALAAEIALTGQLRNSSTIALPPTGRSAPVVGASTGIEPMFRLTSDHTDDIHPAARAALEDIGRDDLLAHVQAHGRLPLDPGLPEAVVALLATATQIAPAGHLAMAAAVQECVDEAVSKTVNLPGNARSIDVYDTLVTAWELGCKGITVFVDGSRQIQPKAL
jgi:ribonucleoside-diphosphate reductase alpha chain